MFPEYIDYINKLHEINTWIWLVSIIAPFSMYCLKIGSRSYYIAAAVWVISQFLNLRIEPYLDAIVSVSREHLVYWYGTWATLDVICIFVIYFAHIRHKTGIGFTSLSVMFAYAALGFMQIVRYLEVSFFETNYLSSLYTLGINSGNIAISTLIALPLACYFWEYLFVQRNKNV